MGRRKYLTQKQLAVLDDLFNGELDEQAVLKEHRVRRGTYERWLADQAFAEQFKQYVNVLARRSELLLAKYSCVAAAKLVELTASAKGEIARRACIDIMGMPKRISQQLEAAKVSECSEVAEIPRLSARAASKLLAVLAEDKG
ncbi:MAG: hypothetical protein JSV99_07260 [Planctomycetota bacterium]|nr:MAG: hypothetical protein JSV99_07260 [Planctomycetota bacterium]